MCIRDRSYSAIKTKELATTLWIKNEIKQLYSKKSLLNTVLMKKHLELLQKLHPSQIDNVTYLIEKQINKTIMKKKKTQNIKISNLLKVQNDPQKNNTISHRFYPRIVNLTEINFNNEETNLLNKGLKYCFKNKGFKQSLINEILNAETAINAISDEETRTVVRHAVDNKITKVLKAENIKTSYNKETKIFNGIKKKLIDNNSIVTKADKGQTLVILTNEDYKRKINEFFINNNIICFWRQIQCLNYLFSSVCHRNALWVYPVSKVNRQDGGLLLNKISVECIPNQFLQIK